MMDSGTPASVATVRPMRQDAPLSALGWTPMVFRAGVTMVETRAGEGVGRGGTTVGVVGEFREEGLIDGAPLAGAAVAVGAGPSSSEIHEEA